MTEKTRRNLAVVLVEAESTARDGRERWRVASNGEIRSLTTRSSSTTAMDQAMVIYRDALERLANR
jgi:hypothetical protein